jgi:hypothetical protein
VLNTKTLESADAQARRRLTGLFRQVGCKPFNYSLLSEAIRGNYAYPHTIAYEFARAYCRKSGRAEQFPRIAIDYYADAGLQASAAMRGDAQLIAVSAGVPVLLLAVFFEVFRSTHPFSVEYDSPDAESTEAGDYRLPLRLTDQQSLEPGDLAALIEQTIRDTIPDGKWRRIWAVTLTELAVLFVFAHELGHVVRGHTTVLGTRRQRALVEIEKAPRRKPTLYRIRQAWELDADETAFAFLWSYALANPDNRKRLMRQLQCGRGEFPEVKLVARLCYAISMVFLLLGQAQREVNAVDSHPSALVRITYLIAFAQTALEALVPGVPPGVVESEIQTAHAQAEAAWNRIGLQFGVNSFVDTVESLPLAINQLDRRRERARAAFGSYAWRFRQPTGD